MPEGQPEMIPMPDGPQPDSRGPMPESFERKLSPEEEKNLLVNFMGNMYGETKKLDNNIVGASTTLERGKSEKIKQQIEQVISQPQQSVPQQVQAAPPPVVQQPQVQAQQPVTPIQQVVEQPQVDDNQLMFSFDTNEKQDLLNRIDELSSKISQNTQRTKELFDKIDKIFEQVTTTSLPIKKQAKKKSVEPKGET